MSKSNKKCKQLICDNLKHKTGDEFTFFDKKLTRLDFVPMFDCYAWVTCYLGTVSIKGSEM